MNRPITQPNPEPDTDPNSEFDTVKQTRQKTYHLLINYIPHVNRIYLPDVIHCIPQRKQVFKRQIHGLERNAHVEQLDGDVEKVEERD